MSLMLTASGRTFDPRAMAADGTTGSVTIEDIAHSLSHICRFGGHCERAYSVAEHSLYVADILKSRGLPAAGQLAGLLHDGHEAYCGDVPTPIKVALGTSWRQFEDCIERTVHAALRVTDLMVRWADEVKAADAAALVTEIRWLFQAPADVESRIRALGLEDIPPHGAPPVSRLHARVEFLNRYHDLIAADVAAQLEKEASMGTPSSTPTLPSVTLDAAGLAAILHCSVDTVVSNAHRAPGRLPPKIRTGGRRLIWLTADVMSWLEARRAGPAPRLRR